MNYSILGVLPSLPIPALQEVTAFQHAMQLIKNVCNVDFVTAVNQADADIIVVL